MYRTYERERMLYYLERDLTETDGKGVFLTGLSQLEARLPR